LLQTTLTEEERLNGILKNASAEKDRIMVAFRQIVDQEILRNKPKKIDPDTPPNDTCVLRLLLLSQCNAAAELMVPANSVLLCLCERM
jgi:hypothetical protein